MNSNFKVINLTRLRIKPRSTTSEGDALAIRASELLKFVVNDLVVGFVPGTTWKTRACHWWYAYTQFGNHWPISCLLFVLPLFKLPTTIFISKVFCL